jgi:hypothetical protein
MGWWSIREDQDAEALSPAYGSNYRLRQRKAEIVISYRNNQVLTRPNRTRRFWPCRMQRQPTAGPAVPTPGEALTHLVNPAWSADPI